MWVEETQTLVPCVGKLGQSNYTLYVGVLFNNIVTIQASCSCPSRTLLFLFFSVCEIWEKGPNQHGCFPPYIGPVEKSSCEIGSWASHVSLDILNGIWRVKSSKPMCHLCSLCVIVSTKFSKWKHCSGEKRTMRKTWLLTAGVLACVNHQSVGHVR